MDGYLPLLIAACGFVIGLIIGLLITVYALRHREKRKRKKRLKKKRKAAEKRAKAEEKAEKKAEKEARAREPREGRGRRRKEPEEETVSIKDRMVNRDDASWTRFNCELDEKDNSEYVEDRRNRQDGSYSYVKKKNNRNP